MLLRIWRFFTLVFAALGLSMGAAHVLEMAPKMQYGAELYAQVTSTLYLMFGAAGAFIQVGAIILAIVLMILSRGRPGFGWAFTGMLGLVASLLIWFSAVAPVNAEWARVMAEAPDNRCLRVTGDPAQ